jgi:hypothetical protein
MSSFESVWNASFGLTPTCGPNLKQRPSRRTSTSTRSAAEEDSIIHLWRRLSMYYAHNYSVLAVCTHSTSGRRFLFLLIHNVGRQQLCGLFRLCLPFSANACRASTRTVHSRSHPPYYTFSEHRDAPLIFIQCFEYVHERFTDWPLAYVCTGANIRRYGWSEDARVD